MPLEDYPTPTSDTPEVSIQPAHQPIVVSPNDHSPKKPNWIAACRRSPKTTAIIFIAFFAVVGTAVLLITHAATSPIATLEAETMTLPSGTAVIADPAASGTKAIEFSTNGLATASVSLPGTADSFTVRAKGDQCKGAPAMIVRVDGNQVGSATSVSATTWTDYSFTKSLPSGNHIMKLEFSNDNNKGCSRNLYVDKVTFMGTVVSNLPVITFSASPTSVTAGSSSTLTWSSINATSCNASGAWTGVQPTNGSTSTGALNTTSTYTLTCTGAGGSTSSSLTVTVSSPPPVGNIYYNTTPSGQCVRSGGCTVTTNLPKSDTFCSANITPTTWEPRTDNYTANHTQGPADLSSIPWGPDAISNYWLNADTNTKKVDGYYTGLTTQIIQWASCKWGIDEDTVRAVAVTESDWHQNLQSDVANGCAHSFGIIQVRDSTNTTCPIAHNSLGGMAYTQNSTAVNLDFFGATFRSCYDGDFYDGGAYLYGGQTVAQVAASKGWDYVFWGCIGQWYSGGWYDAGATNYINTVKSHLANKDWTKY